MKRKRYADEQIAFALRQAEVGRRWRRSAGGWASPSRRFYGGKKQFAGMGVAEIRRLKQLEEENAKLKRLVADLTLDKTMLQDVLRRNLWSASVSSHSGIGARAACVNLSGL